MVSTPEVFRNPFWAVLAVPHGLDTYYVVKQGDSVPVIARMPDERTVLVDTWRIAHQKTFTEFPGGAIDEGETPREAAVRELEEETGIRGTSCEVIGQVTPSTALTTETCHVCMVRDILEVGTPSTDEVDRVRLVNADRVVDELVTGGCDAVAAAAWALAGWRLPR